MIVKMLQQIFMEHHPVLPVQQKSTEPDDVCDKFQIVLLRQFFIFPIIFNPSADNFFYQMPRCLYSGTIGMQTGLVFFIFNQFFQKHIPDHVKAVHAIGIVLRNRFQIRPAHTGFFIHLFRNGILV